MNTYSIDYSKKTLKLVFDNETYNFDLNEGDIGDYWNSFTHKNKLYDVNFHKEGIGTQSYVCTYEVDKGSILWSTKKSIKLLNIEGDEFSYLYPGFLQTDGSLETLQYANKITDLSWVYFELGGEYSNVLEAEKDFDNWYPQLIDLQKYSKSEVEDIISSYGYKLESYDLNKNLVILEGYDFNSSVQLICECISEDLK